MTDEAGKPARRLELDPVETELMHRDIQKDIAEGNGAKHFQDVLDELHSTQPRESNRLDAMSEEKIVREYAEIQRQLKIDVTRILLRDAMRVTKCILTRNEARELDGFRVELKDAEQREFAVVVTFDEALSYGADHPDRAVYQHIVESVVSRAIQERAYYLRRMQANLVSGE